jgi:hypothetical protein
MIMNSPCDYCGADLPAGIDKATRRTRSFHFACCAVRLAAHNPPPVSGEDILTLPSLPEPGIRGPSGTGAYFDGYTADQLRADRLAVAQAVREACIAACEAVEARQFDGYDGDYENGVESGADQCADAIRALQIEVNDANV